MWLGVLGIIGGIAGGLSFVYSLGDILASGAWKDWSLWQWIANIGQLLFCIFPFVSSIPMLGRVGAVVGGILAKLLAKIPLVGSIASWIWAGWHAVKVFFNLYLMKWFVKGGWLYEMGKAVAKLVQYCRKPWVLFGLLLLSTFSDGILTRVFQLWGDLTMRAGSAAFEAVSRMMSEGGYGNPISESIAILTGAKSTLPPCFTAIWGAVGASQCIGLIVTTFQYIMLLSALRQGYKLYGKNGVGVGGPD